MRAEHAGVNKRLDPHFGAALAEEHVLARLVAVGADLELEPRLWDGIEDLAGDQTAAQARNVGLERMVGEVAVEAVGVGAHLPGNRRAQPRSAPASGPAFT